MLDPNASIVRHRSPHISTCTRVGPARRPGPTVTRGRHMCLTCMNGSWVYLPMRTNKPSRGNRPRVTGRLS
eukprot:7336921-Prymnesium_polylepis.1